MAIVDYFSSQSPLYRRHRPHYPGELFGYLASLVPFHGLAWDVGTGNGQAALGLSKYFDRVVATDASSAQIENALQNERVDYRVSPAESIDLEPHSVDLVTAAQSLHWFELDAFYAEVLRVLKPDGLLAAWCYNLTRVTPEIDAILDGFYFDTVGPYWSPRIQYVDDHYATLPFPFEETTGPAIELKAVWSQEDMEGYLRSWSSTQEFIRVRKHDPVADVHAMLAHVWGSAERERLVRWPLYFRIGRVGGARLAALGKRQHAHSA